ncbi:hypothetical protein RADP37_04532 (plasmid) [Roseomonas mucosa]|uniref:Uncharacterized protein n=1 Tax=Roseomonas mucosa TaxID=207340 RepID=A0A4Y1MQJ6_9PROT|nr:hypothetical protein [Roseomonas mucosa]AWV20246.1 hypothetical protein RADP37_04532 [Roseomonas mucosa]QDD97219.1 hypothetical protein ADP8_04532a [Roseomonas mucosa]
MDDQPNTNPLRTAVSAEVLRRLDHQDTVLHHLGEQLAAIIRLLTPAPQEGPTTTEMLQAIVALLGEHTPLLRDLEGHALNLTRELPRLVAHEVVLAQRFGARQP